MVTVVIMERYDHDRSFILHGAVRTVLFRNLTAFDKCSHFNLLPVSKMSILALINLGYYNLIIAGM